MCNWVNRPPAIFQEKESPILSEQLAEALPSSNSLSLDQRAGQTEDSLVNLNLVSAPLPSVHPVRPDGTPKTAEDVLDILTNDNVSDREVEPTLELDNESQIALEVEEDGHNNDSQTENPTMVLAEQSIKSILTGSYSSFQELYESVQTYANTLVFGLSRNLRNFTKDEFSREYGDAEFSKIPRRGYFYCSDCGLPDRSDRFRIQFHFNSESHQYDIDENLCCLKHIHILKSDEVRASSRLVISYQNQLTAAELQYVLDLGASSVDVAKAREMMRKKFHDRDYEGQLLFRLLKKGYENFHGADYDAINQLIDFGVKYRAEGGKFEFRIGSDMRLTDVIVAKPSMMPYLKQYGDFVIVDGTHGCDTYGMIALINTLVDCLGNSVISSYSHCRSETFQHIQLALRTLDLIGCGTLISDNNPAFSMVCEEFGKVHLLCVKHYSDKIFSCRSGLSSDLSQSFIRDMNDAIFKDMMAPDSLTSHFQNCKEKYGCSPKALEFIERLEKDQRKVCRTYTAKVFSAGAIATQRGEGSNARLKNKGRKKTELKKFNLFQFAQHVESLVELQEQRTLIVIRKLVKGEFDCSYRTFGTNCDRGSTVESICS